METKITVNANEFKMLSLNLMRSWDNLIKSGIEKSEGLKRLNEIVQNSQLRKSIPLSINNCDIVYKLLKINGIFE